MFIIVTDVSVAQRQIFDLTLTRNNKVIREADKLTMQDFTVKSANELYYRNKYYITIRPRFCACSGFLDICTCRHYIAACNLTNNYFDNEDREFNTVKSRGRPKKCTR